MTTYRTEEEARSAAVAAEARGDLVGAFEAAEQAIDFRHAQREATRATAATANAPKKATTARGSTLTLPSRNELAVAELTARGATREAALERVLSEPTIITELAAEITAAQERLVAEANASEDSAWAESPEGRKAAAIETARQRDERQRLAEAARELLVQEGHRADDLANLTPDELLDVSGIEPSPERIEAERWNNVGFQQSEAVKRERADLRRNWNTLTQDEREFAKDNPMIGPAAYEEIRAEREIAAARELAKRKEAS